MITGTKLREFVLANIEKIAEYEQMKNAHLPHPNLKGLNERIEQQLLESFIDIVEPSLECLSDGIEQPSVEGWLLGL